MARIGAAQGARILVATDCLSEGINLQEHFDAVVHYDLSWNPTRHEQREGRVDRFGQPSPTVRATLLYGADNPVDGAVLQVILRKAARIREELGVPVPVPDEGRSLTQALLKAVLLRRRGLSDAVEGRQLGLFESRLGRREGEGQAEPDRVRPATYQAGRGAAGVAQEPRRESAAVTMCSALPAARSPGSARGSSRRDGDSRSRRHRCRRRSASVWTTRTSRARLPSTSPIRRRLDAVPSSAAIPSSSVLADTLAGSDPFGRRQRHLGRRRPDPRPFDPRARRLLDIGGRAWPHDGRAPPAAPPTPVPHACAVRRRR